MTDRIPDEADMEAMADQIDLTVPALVAMFEARKVSPQVAALSMVVLLAQITDCGTVPPAKAWEAYGVLFLKLASGTH